jgi:hypothetical protein
LIMIRLGMHRISSRIDRADRKKDRNWDCISAVEFCCLCLPVYKGNIF